MQRAETNAKPSFDTLIRAGHPYQKPYVIVMTIDTGPADERKAQFTSASNYYTKLGNCTVINDRETVFDPNRNKKQGIGMSTVMEETITTSKQWKVRANDQSNSQKGCVLVVTAHGNIQINVWRVKLGKAENEKLTKVKDSVTNFEKSHNVEFSTIVLDSCWLP